MQTKLYTTAFRAWCAAKSIQTCLEIRLNDEDGSRYTVLQQERNERTSDRTKLLEVPLDSCIIADSSEELADRLLFEKNLGQDSDFAPYINLMPTRDSFVDLLPRFWSPERLDTVRDGGQLNQALQQDFPRYHRESNDYAWALACVDSRSHFLPDGRYSLTPVLDMINHDPSVDTSLRVLEQENEREREIDANLTGSIVLEADLNNLAGTDTPPSWMDRLGPWFGYRTSKTQNRRDGEVCISYGDFTNLHTLLNYGFVTPRNSNNYENLNVRLLSTSSDVSLLVGQENGSLDQFAMGQLRLAIASPQELENIDKTKRYLPTTFISKRNEEEVYGLVAGELHVAVENVLEGINVADARRDTLVVTYLRERLATFEAALQRIRQHFPQVMM